MASIDISASKMTIQDSNGWLDKMARRLIFAKLENITSGRLVLEENGRSYVFGNINHIVSEQNSVVDGAYTYEAKIHIENIRAYRHILLNGTIGCAEAYMLKLWTSPDLVGVVRFFIVNRETLGNMESSWSWISKRYWNFLERFKKNTLHGSRRNISAHYDLSNDFFKLFLDREMMYSAAIYRSVDEPEKTLTLDEAAKNKLHIICRSLKLTANDHLLEVGTGWGGMAIYAASHFGCRVTTTTISKQQYEYATNRVQDLGLQDRVTVLLKDYRLLDGVYDKIVSIEMIEAVGHQFYRQFYSKCQSLLKTNGLMLIQAITTLDQRFDAEKDQIDFIRAYIFPGGCLPSVQALQRAATHVSDFSLLGLRDMTLDYAKTLADWRDRFWAQQEHVEGLGFDDVFMRMWDFYLCYCQGGFEQRYIHTMQLLYCRGEYLGEG